MKLVRKLKWWWFHKRLNWVAHFLLKHHLYNVTLNEDLLKVWSKDWYKYLYGKK